MAKYAILTDRRFKSPGGSPMVAFLKRQEDGRFTINVGSVRESGDDLWFSTEASDTPTARAMFRQFMEIHKKWSGKDPIGMFDKFLMKDFYILDDREVSGKGYY